MRRLCNAAACAVALLLSACGDVTVTKTVTVVHESERPSKTQEPPRRASRVQAAPPPAYRACDANIEVRASTTTCAFAQNVFLAFWVAETYGSESLSAYSPAAARAFALACSGASRIACSAGDGAKVRFPRAAIEAYDVSQAMSYVAGHDVGDMRLPWASDGAGSADLDDSGDVAPPTGDDDSDVGSGENIPNYDEGRGYRVQCADGTYSQSGGIQGACSHHGGVG